MLWSIDTCQNKIFATERRPRQQYQTTLKKKYETAASGKTQVQGMIEHLEEYLMDVHTTVMGMIVKAQQSLRCWTKLLSNLTH